MAIKVDLSGHEPYKAMGESCRLRDIEEFRVRWPRLVIADELAGTGYLMRYIRRDDADALVEIWKNVYPEAYGSTHQFVLDPEWYRPENVLLEENWERDAAEKDHAIVVLEQTERKRLLGLLLLTKWNQNLQIELTMGGLHPALREKNVFYPFFRNILDAIESTEAELLTVFAETWHKKTQELMDHNGFKIWGVFPGQMIRWSHGEKCYRACEVHYYKFINGGETRASKPEAWVLSAKVAEVWEVLKRAND